MKKKIIIALIVIIIVGFIVSLISFLITINGAADNTNKESTQENQSEKNVSENNTIDKSQYADININSALALQIFDFVPKYLQNNANRMSNEYIIYSSISKLEDRNVNPVNIDGSDGKFPGYKSSDVIDTAKELYGEKVEITKQEKYNLPIGYDNKNDIFFKYPMGFDSVEEFQVIKELKENDKTYKLTIYALNVEYDVNDFNHIYIETKDTFKLYQNKVNDENKIKNSMKEYNLSGIDLDPTQIANEFKDDLPLIEYELEKLDDRGAKYFVKNIKFILD